MQDFPTNVSAATVRNGNFVLPSENVKKNNNKPWITTEIQVHKPNINLVPLLLWRTPLKFKIGDALLF